MEEILKKLQEQDQKLDDIYKMTRKVKNYFLTIIIFSLITFVLPLLGLIFIIPWFMRTMGSAYQDFL